MNRLRSLLFKWLFKWSWYQYAFCIGLSASILGIKGEVSLELDWYTASSLFLILHQPIAFFLYNLYSLLYNREIKIIKEAQRDTSRRKEYVKNTMTEVFESGGEIYSTYFMERANISEFGDVVNEAIRDSRKSNDNEVTYKRFIMVDDETKEKNIIEEFLKESDKEWITSTIYRIKSPKRPIVRFLRNVLPILSITLVRSDLDTVTDSTYLSVQEIYSREEGEGYDTEFGIISKNNYVNSAVKEMLDVISNYHGITTEVETLTDYDKKIRPVYPNALVERSLYTLEEISRYDAQIKHLGVFGSVGRYMRKTTQKIPKYNGVDRGDIKDIDVILVIGRGEHKGRIKSSIKEGLKSEFEDTKEEINIVWSKERKTFYYYRRENQIDIQLHIEGEKYYENNKILGYSIFDFNYKDIYSDEVSGQ